MFLIYFILRVIFLYIYYPSFRFVNLNGILMAFLTSLRFDTSAIVLSNTPFILLSLLPFGFYYQNSYQKILFSLYMIINIFFVFANCVDLVFFNFYRKRMTADIFNFIAIGDDTKNVLPSLLRDFWYVLLICALLTWMMAWLYLRIKVSIDNKPKGGKERLLYALAGLLIFVLCSGAGIIAGRGGTQLKPLKMISAVSTTTPENIPLVANTTFSIISTWGKEKLKEASYFPEEMANRFFASEHKPAGSDSINKVNVVVIILESFSKEYIGYYNEDKRFTPFLDSLISQSLSFPNAFANSKKSIEGIPAILASLPALMEEPYITSSYSSGKINSIASVLKTAGYSSAFFHGGNNGTMNFDNFCYASGFDKYFGRKEYGPEDYDGQWGIYDHKFYRYFISRMDEMQEPFFTSLFTISSHHPFHVPTEFTGKFPKGSHPILESIAYADYSLQTFFHNASNKTWFKNTLFVITADHTGPSVSPKYETRKGIYEIPLLFYMPGVIQPQEDTSVVQQCDVMPSVIGFVKSGQPFISFGNNLFDPHSNRFAVSYLQDTYQLITNKVLIHFDGINLLDTYYWRIDDLLEKNVLSAHRNSLANETNLLKSVIQQFNFRVLHNQLTVKD